MTGVIARHLTAWLLVFLSAQATPAIVVQNVQPSAASTERASAGGKAASEWFTGVWAVACDSVVGQENPLVVVYRSPGLRDLSMVVVSRGGPVLTSDLTKVVIKGRSASGDLIADFDHGKGRVNHALLRAEKNLYFVNQTVRPDGRVTTRDGIALATGLPSRRYQRCSASN